ncbi:MAG: NAD(P)H-hydrate epimerase, partial [Armatimonadota bacterium]|nr:NAD(P)H-hydrate epimerase [Armatimonadota bacterium]
MKLVTSEQMRAIERRAAEIGIPTTVLMEHAGRAVAQVAYKFLGERGGGRVLVVCGKGNNGGDGLCAARHLQNAGVPVRGMLLARDQDLSGDAAANLRAARAAGIEVDNVVGPVDVALWATVSSYQLVVDAIFGTGFRGPAVGLAARVIEALNESRVPILSVDVPSGLEADTGRVEGPCVRATLTVTMGFPKVGMMVHPGADFCGRVVVADLGIPRALVEDLGIHAELSTVAQVRTFLPPRAPDTHKGTYGRVLLVGGSSWFSGAPRLMALGALRTGAGLVRLAVPESIYPAVASSLLEAMPLGLPDEGGILCAASLETILELVREADVVGIGPGMTTRGDVPHLV